MDWQILPYTPVKVLLGRDVVLTGWVDCYAPSFDGRSHRVRVSGRSLTEDLIDCTPDIKSGQFKGYSLSAIANGICALFGITVTIDPSAAAACAESVADATIERCETAWTFLERLCRLAAVLACDTPSGVLLLTRTGNSTASGSLLEGGNIFRASARFDVRKRFSQYIVKGQSGVSAGAGGSSPPSLDGLARVANQTSALPPPKPASGTGRVIIGQRAEADDAGVPRFRPHVTIAESQLNQAQMQQRANWQRAYAYGRSIEIEITVKGWRQPDGRLWQLNQLVPVVAPHLGLDQDLLIVKVDYRTGNEGPVTDLTVAPPEGYTPDPGEVRCRKHRGKHGKKGRAMADYNGLASVGP